MQEYQHTLRKVLVDLLALEGLLRSLLLGFAISLLSLNAASFHSKGLQQQESKDVNLDF